MSQELLQLLELQARLHRKSNANALADLFENSIKEIKTQTDKVFFYEAALVDIKKHQEILGGDISKLGVVHTIATTVLNRCKQGQ